MSQWLRAGCFFAAVVLVLAPCAAIAFIPYVQGCVLKTAVAMPCPGCGLGGALLALEAGNPLLAVKTYPPLLPLTALFIAAFYALMGSAVLRRSPRGGLRGVERAGLASVALIVVHWIRLISSS